MAVVQGHSPDTGWRNLAEAHRRPARRRGLGRLQPRRAPCRPSAACCPATAPWSPRCASATGREPQVAGKPAPALLHAVRASASAARATARWSATGSTPTSRAAAPRAAHAAGSDRASPTPAELLAAPPERRPDYVAADLACAHPRPGRTRARAPARLDRRGRTGAWHSRCAARRPRSTRCARCARRTGRRAAARHRHATARAEAGAGALRLGAPASARPPWRLPGRCARSPRDRG